MYIKTIILLLSLTFFFLGCGHKKLNVNNPASVQEEAPLLCEEKAPPKSLQELEQNYRCRGE